MLELAAEWKVFSMMHKCERLIVRIIEALRALPCWRALVQQGSEEGAVRSLQKAEGSIEQGLHPVELCLRQLAWVAIISSR